MSSSNLKPNDRLLRLENALAFAESQVKSLIETHPDFFPIYTAKGRWKHSGEAWTNWCEGFLPGILWILHQLTAKPYWRDKAEHYSRLLEHRKTDRKVHDLGFVFMSSYGRGYNLTHDPELREILIEAGRTLALRFQEKGQYLCSFVAPESLFIDIMMNVGIIFWAAEKTQDARLKELASRHCRTTQRYLVHEDGSTVHEGLFDLVTGKFLRASTHQGWGPESCWSRGLCWALYGFETAYQFTHDASFLETSERCADYYIRHVPGNRIPYWDFNVPEGPDRLWDSSAAAIAASGLWNLSASTPSKEKARVYRDIAFEIMDTLASTDFLGEGHKGQEGILLHGLYHYHKKLGVDESVMWGEYFFMEALQKTLNALRGS
ncbi:MAG: glucuronyl hydrolase [Acidobacteria bacterium]|nr:MAG: glucuronyl hydrolase [Acidobacteriota bacterium]